MRIATKKLISSPFNLYSFVDFFHKNANIIKNSVKNYNTIILRRRSSKFLE